MNLWLYDLQHTTLTKAEISDRLAQTLGLSYREAHEVVDGFFELLNQQLAQGQTVKLANFGTFRILEKSARPGRNLRTAEQVQIMARRSVSFSSGPKLRSILHAPVNTAPGCRAADAESAGRAITPHVPSGPSSNKTGDRTAGQRS